MKVQIEMSQRLVNERIAKRSRELFGRMSKICLFLPHQIEDYPRGPPSYTAKPQTKKL